MRNRTQPIYTSGVRRIRDRETPLVAQPSYNRNFLTDATPTIATYDPFYTVGAITGGGGPSGYGVVGNKGVLQFQRPGEPNTELSKQLPIEYEVTSSNVPVQPYGYKFAPSVYNVFRQTTTLGAIWVVSNLTKSASPAVTGPDGLTSAFVLTATANNGAITQTIGAFPPGSQTFVFSIWVRRVTGTGAFQMTVNNTTWTTVAVTSNWKRVFVTGTGPVLSDPKILGVRLATINDVVEVAFPVCELTSGPAFVQPTMEIVSSQTSPSYSSNLYLAYVSDLENPITWYGNELLNKLEGTILIEVDLTTRGLVSDAGYALFSFDDEADTYFSLSVVRGTEPAVADTGYIVFSATNQGDVIVDDSLAGPFSNTKFKLAISWKDQSNLVYAYTDLTAQNRVGIQDFSSLGAIIKAPRFGAIICQGISSYMKNIRVWKDYKTPAELINIFNQTV